jgi:hypothetical protein
MNSRLPRQFKMSAQADWNHLVVDLRNNIFKLVFFAFDCSKPAADDVLPATSGDAESSHSSSSSSDSSVHRKKKMSARKKVRRVPPPQPPSVSKSRRSSTQSGPVKRKKRMSAAPPSTSIPMAEDVIAANRLVVEDVNFQNLLY